MLRATAYHGALGDAFAALSETSAHNAYIDRPAMLALAGDVAGLRVLDVGCGPGHYAAALAERGATVLGVDGSAALLEHARVRTGGAVLGGAAEGGARVDGASESGTVGNHSVELRRHDLETPLDFAADASFDLAVCALVIHHIRDRDALLREIFRVLRPGGALLISTTHPTADWTHFGGSYFSRDWVDLRSPGDDGLAIHFQRNTIEGLLNELLAAGFVLETLREPRAVPELEAVDAASYERLNRNPSLLAARLRRP